MSNDVIDHYQAYDPNTEDVYPKGQVQDLLAYSRRLEAALLVLASVLDLRQREISPHYPLALSNPELPLHPDDLDGLWFGTWESTRAALHDDPRWTGEVVNE